MTKMLRKVRSHLSCKVQTLKAKRLIKGASIEIQLKDLTHPMITIKKTNKSDKPPTQME